MLNHVVSQFGYPRGTAGRLAGMLMAHRSSNRRRNEWVISLLEVRPEDRVLEVGFGPGIAIRGLTRLVTSGRICGIDHSELMVGEARKRNADAVRSGLVDLRLASVDRLPAFDEPFDAIFAVNSVGFWPEPVARLKELRALLAPGGRIAIASQPRSRGATVATTERAAREITSMLDAAGFDRLRTETLQLEPPVACVLGAGHN